MKLSWVIVLTFLLVGATTAERQQPISIDIRDMMPKTSPVTAAANFSSNRIANYVPSRGIRCVSTHEPECGGEGMDPTTTDETIPQNILEHPRGVANNTASSDKAGAQHNEGGDLPRQRNGNNGRSVFANISPDVNNVGPYASGHDPAYGEEEKGPMDETHPQSWTQPNNADHVRPWTTSRRRKTIT